MNLYEVPKNVINSVCEFPDEFRSKVVKMALVAHQSTTQDRSKLIEHLSNESGISKGRIYEVIGVFISLINFFLATNDNEFNSKLIDLGFTLDFVEKLPFISNRDEIVNNLINNNNMDFGKLSSLKWRIDISLGNSVLVKKIPTSILLTLTMKNGTKHTIAVETKTFHLLRFNVALILKELSLLKSTSIK